MFKLKCLFVDSTVCVFFLFPVVKSSVFSAFVYKHKHMESQTKGKKAANWTKLEQVVLTEECAKYAHILKAKFSHKVTQEDKNRIWKLIQEKVNALGNDRSVNQCYKRWQNFNSRAATEVRKFIKESKKTGINIFFFFLQSALQTRYAVTQLFQRQEIRTVLQE